MTVSDMEVKQPKKKKDSEWLKVGNRVRILLGPRKSEVDTIKEVFMTPNGSPIYFLNGDEERLAYQSFAIVLEKKAKHAEQVVRLAHFEDLSSQHNDTDEGRTQGK